MKTVKTLTSSRLLQDPCLHIYSRLTVAALLLISFFLFGAFRGAAIAGPSDMGHEQLKSQATAWVAGSARKGPGLSITFADIDPRVLVPICTTNWSFSYPFNNQDTLRASCADPNKKIFLRRLQNAQVLVPVASRPLPAGTPLLSTDYSLELRPRTFEQISVNPRSVSGRILERGLITGEEINTRHLSPFVRVFKTLKQLQPGERFGLSSLSEVRLPISEVSEGALADFSGGLAAAVRNLPAGTVLYGDDVKFLRRAVVSARFIERGKRLDPTDLRVDHIATRLAANAITDDLSSVVGGETLRSYEPGEPILTNTIRAAVMVKRGDLAVLRIGVAGLSVTVRAEALQDGRKGESIKLKNRESGKVIMGRVIGLNEVVGI